MGTMQSPIDSISIVEDFFQATFGTEVRADHVLALSDAELDRLLTAVFEQTCTPPSSVLYAPPTPPPRHVSDKWAAAFHAPSSLFSPKSVCDETPRALPRVLLFERIALVDPLGAVAHYGQDDVWQEINVIRMLRPASPESRCLRARSETP